MDNKNMILEKILGMFDEFEELKTSFELEENTRSMEVYMDRINFLEEKLKVLKIALLDKESKKYCRELKKSIDSFKKESKFNDYTDKLNFIRALNGLENSLDLIRPIELAYALDSLYKYVRLNSQDAKSITEKDYSYLNLLSNTGDKGLDPSQMTSDERFDYAKALLRSLFNFSLTSYNKSNEPFSLSEKIMIISILDSMRIYLRYR